MLWNLKKLTCQIIFSGTGHFPAYIGQPVPAPVRVCTAARHLYPLLYRHHTFLLLPYHFTVQRHCLPDLFPELNKQGIFFSNYPDNVEYTDIDILTSHPNPQACYLWAWMERGKARRSSPSPKQIGGYCLPVLT